MIHKLKLPLAVIGMIIALASCQDDEQPNPGNPAEKSMIQFEQSDLVLESNEQLVEIEIKVDNRHNTDLDVMIVIDSGLPEDQYVISPQPVDDTIRMIAHKNVNSLSLVVRRTSVKVLSESSVRMTLSSSQAEVETGDNDQLVIVVEPDQPESVIKPEASFSESFVHFSESEAMGFPLSIVLNKPFSGTGNLSLKIKDVDPANINSLYSFAPAASSSSYQLEVVDNQQVIDFVIYPVNNEVFAGNHQFTIEIESNDFILAGQNYELQVRIEEDDVAESQAISLRNLKLLHTGQAIRVSDDLFIEGVVTSRDNVMDNKTIYLQDGTAGIGMRFVTSHSWKNGDKLKINLKNAVLHGFNNQLGLTDVVTTASVLLESNVDVQPVIIPLHEITNPDYQGMRVTIEDVTILPHEHTDYFIGTHTIQQDGQRGFITIYESSMITNFKVPSEKVDVTGIIGDWGRLQPQSYYHDIKFY